MPTKAHEIFYKIRFIILPLFIIYLLTFYALIKLMSILKRHNYTNFICSCVSNGLEKQITLILFFYVNLKTLKVNKIINNMLYFM